MKQKYGNRMWKRIVATVLILALLPSLVCAAKRPLSGSAGYHIIWIYDRSTKTMTFRQDPENEEPVYEGDRNCWHDEVEHVVYEEGFEYIGTEMDGFSKCSDIKIPSTVKKIVNRACYNLCSLKTIELNEGLEEIGEYAFEFSGLRSVTMPSTLKSIGEGAFLGNYLKTIVLNEGLEKIGEGAFQGQPLREIRIPNSVKKMGRWVFFGCTKLKEVKLPSHITVLRLGTFEECKSLKSVKLPNSLKVIEDEVFRKSGIERVTIPENVQTLGNKKYPAALICKGMFYKCKNLTRVNIKSRKLKKVHKNTLINTPENVVFVVPSGLKKKYTKLLRNGGLSKKVKIKESKKW